MNQPDPQSRSFEKVMSGIEFGTLKIPQFQREFVWPREKSAKLIDSILKGFPIEARSSCGRRRSNSAS